MTKITDRIHSVPGVSFRYHPRLLGLWLLRAEVRSYPRSTALLGWGFAANLADAAFRAERILEAHGALQPPPEAAHG